MTLTELMLNTNKFNLPEISVHDEANNAQADKCIFPFVHISYPQDNHGYDVRSLQVTQAGVGLKFPAASERR